MLKIGRWKIVLAAAFVVVALWVWIGREKDGGDVIAGERTAVTKPHPRERDERMERRTKNPREEFESARKRGMTEDEVRGVVEEFHELGYSELKQKGGSLDEFRVFRSKVWQWYSDLLAEGFGFTGEQERLVSKRLQEMGEKDFSTQLEVFGKLIPDSSQDARISSENTEALEILLGTRVWLAWQKYEVWELCNLNEDQMEIGWGAVAKFGQSWVIGKERTKDPDTDDHYNDLENPFEPAHQVFSESGKIFPLSMEQVDRIRSVKENSLLEYVKFLTLGQLRTLLLFRPELAGKLMKELGSEGKSPFPRAQRAIGANRPRLSPELTD